MAKATDVVSEPVDGPNGVGARPTALLVSEALRERIGGERYAVWFGDGVGIEVEAAGDVQTPDGAPAGMCVIVRVGSVFAQEWLRRTFRVDVEAVTLAVCGPSACVVWRTDAAVVAPLADTAVRGTESSPGVSSGLQNRRHRAAAAVPGDRAARRGCSGRRGREKNRLRQPAIGSRPRRFRGRTEQQDGVCGG